MKLLDVSTKKYPNTFAMVDDEDYDYLNKWKWGAFYGRNTTYAMRSPRLPDGTHTSICLHRFIMNPEKGIHVDHINGNGLDNRRDNLRLCTIVQNQQNQQNCRGGSSKYKGVCWHKHTKKWQARIGVRQVKVHLGVFNDETDAAIAYNEAAKHYFGEFANLNII